MTKTLIALLVTALSAWALTLGQSAPAVTLEGENGGTVQNKPWSSQESLKEKVHVLFYVDPDEKDTNNDLSQALKMEKFDRNLYGSIAIINLAATWMPNFAIEAKLKKKQELYPDTLYVKDKNKVLVHTWHIADDNSNVMLFNKKGELIYLYEGKLGEDEIAKVIQLIKENL
jgi:hypothetical protein